MIRLSKSVIGAAEQAAVAKVLERGFLGTGPETQAFEREIARYLGGGVTAVCVSTGTAALQLAVQACGLGPGDEVLVPSLTYVASFQAISAAGATPIACDVREATGLLNLDDAERRAGPRVKAVMPVHYASAAGDPEDIYVFARQRGLRVIEDAAHAFGCTHQGRKIGSFGDVVCFSFDGIKNITSGEGGAIVSRDPEVIARVQDARLLGVQKDSEKRYKGERSWDFDVTEQGWRSHMSDIMAAIGRVQLGRLEPEFKPQRIALAKRYRERLAEIPGVQLFATDLNEIVPHIQPVRILGGRRDRVRQALSEQAIQTGIHYKPNHLLTRYGGGAVSLPVSERLYEELLSLPLHPELSLADVDAVVDCLAVALGHSSSCKLSYSAADWARV